MSVEENQVEEVRVWQSYEYASGKQARNLSYCRNRNSQTKQTNALHIHNCKSSSSRQHSAVFSRFHEQLGYDRDEDDVVVLEKINEGVDVDGNLDDITHENVRHIFSVYFERDCHHCLLPHNTTKARSGQKKREMEKTSSCLKRFYDKTVKSTNGTMPWSQDYIRKQMPFPEIFVFVELCLRGIGQVVFQNNPITGLFILAGLFLQSTRVAVYGVIGTVSGTIIAYLLGFEKGFKQSGLFGYNSLLCGLAMATFDDPNKHQGYSAAIVILTIVFSCFSSILFVFMGKVLVPYKSPPFTLPFNASVMMYLLATANMSRIETESVGVPMLPEYDNDVNTTITISAFFYGCIRGIGQIFLADDIISGVLILAGIAVCSRISAVVALIGSILGAAVGVAVGVPGAQVESGLYGFNPCLTVIAMYMFYVPSQSSFVLAILAGIMTVMAQQALTTLLQPYGLPFMTLPFCVAALPFVIIQGTSSALIAVPLSSITVPEDHLKKIRCLRKGFDFLKEALYPENARDFLKKGSSNSYRKDELDKTLHCCNKDTYADETLKTDVEEGIISSEESASDQSGLSSQSFRAGNTCLKTLLLCRKTNQRTDHSWVFKAATEIFKVMDTKRSGALTIEDFQYMLRKVGLNDKSGHRFATLVIKIIDTHKSNSIGPQEWVQFCLISVQLRVIRKKISKFLDFVNLEQRDVIYIRELNTALNYLGKPCLSDTDRGILFSVLNLDNIEDDGSNTGINVVDLINYVTISKVKAIVHEYRQ